MHTRACWLAMLFGVGGLPSHAIAAELTAPLAYESSAYELAASIPPDAPPWTQAGLQRELLARAAREKRRHELDVDYYRIGYTLAFPLPVAHRPTPAELPEGIHATKYPWLIWLSWALEERWRVLHAAWRTHGDREAGALLQRELAALKGWEKFVETNEQTGLVTAHLAACLSLALANRDGWDAALLADAHVAAEKLIERDVWPWFEKQWSADTFTPAKLPNIPVIALARAAQLARVIGSPRAGALDRKMSVVLRAWCRFRTGPEHHTEGTAYDGYLFDSATEWLETAPDRAELRRENRAAFRSLADAWIALTLPGRVDLHAPLGDVEPEMPFWANALARFADWYGWDGAAWLLARFPVQRLPAAALVAATAKTSAAPPALAPRELPHAVALRTGWASADRLAVVSLARSAMGHLHLDAGQVILGWQHRFWITDPGYQQYRPGEERDYSIGPQAHNGPVIDGAAQKTRAARLLALTTDERGWQHTSVELAACYAALPRGASVRREVWLGGADAPALIVRDTFRGLGQPTKIDTSWLGGAQFAWAFVDGWVRMSDGEHALWFGTWPDALSAAMLTRHAGSRGPLTLAHPSQLAKGEGTRWWIFWCDASGGWTPPAMAADGTKLSVTAPVRGAGAWVIE